MEIFKGPWRSFKDFHQGKSPPVPSFKQLKTYHIKKKSLSFQNMVLKLWATHEMNLWERKIQGALEWNLIFLTWQFKSATGTKIHRFISAKFCRRISRFVHISPENWTTNLPSKYFLAPKSRKMCPPLLKTCSSVIAQFNSSWRQRLTSVAFPCVLTEDIYRRLRNVRRVFLRFGTVFSFRSIWGFVSFGKWRIFLTVRCKNWCEVSTNNLVNKLFKVFFSRHIIWVIWREFKTWAKYAYTMIIVQAPVAQKVDNSFSTDKLPSGG